ncbi:hypothetical protein [Stackebrandtia nassauensis]|uniref:hypothetical protein n=1 Tax=Stackebrandtia nassauensis TaxID=283811 RepID=UPI001184C153|nr:hypothetical protein [Stackebrandtia nassauensis]
MNINSPTHVDISSPDDKVRCQYSNKSGYLISVGPKGLHDITEETLETLIEDLLIEVRTLIRDRNAGILHEVRMTQQPKIMNTPQGKWLWEEYKRHRDQAFADTNATATAVSGDVTVAVFVNGDVLVALQPGCLRRGDSQIVDRINEAIRSSMRQLDSEIKAIEQSLDKKMTRIREELENGR